MFLYGSVLELLIC